MNAAPVAAERYIGLMSGTSLDGIDGVLCGFDVQGRWAGVEHAVHRPFDPALRQALFELQSPGPDECHRMAVGANALALACGEVCQALLHATGRQRADVRAIGVHGQTLRHQPPPPGSAPGTGYTVQLNQPALLAELAGIDVVADFRSRDIAAGGQGAPLVPPFHQAVFSAGDAVRVVVNIGGMANVTVLDPQQALTGFDCGPGNALLDHWCEQHTGRPYDDAGAWGAAGRVHAGLLGAMRAEPFFGLPPPKSTGRDLFNTVWLQRHLDAAPAIAAVDVQATLAQLTAQGIADAVTQGAPHCQSVLVCGGGALNSDLMARLQALLPGMALESTDRHGLPPLQVEAAAFAWLARMHVHRLPANAVSVTGARGRRVLGACYPA